MISRTKQVSRTLNIIRWKSNKSNNEALYLNPHAWEGLPADRIFELHNLRKDALKENYNPNNEERNAILSTFASLGKTKPALDYVYEIDNFKERYMNNTPVNLRGLPPKKSNVYVSAKGETSHKLRQKEHLKRLMAYELPLLAKLRQPYEPKSDKETPLKVTYNTDFSNGSNSSNRKVTLSVKLDDLSLNEKQQHKFIVLSGNKFNHNTRSLRFSVEDSPEPSQNARLIGDRFLRLLTESKDLTDDLSDIPIDTRHTKPQKKRASFPDAWKRPDQAPTVKHSITRRVIDDIKLRKDQQYIDQLSP